MSNGCSARPAARRRRLSSPRSTRRRGRCLRGTPGASSSGTRGVRRPRRPAALMDRRPDGVPRPQRHARSAAALAAEAPLSNRVGAGLDPCGALQTRLELKANDTAEIVFLLGETATEAEARSLLGRIGPPTSTRSSAPRRLWDDALGAVQVTTPDRSHGHSAEPLAALPDPRV